MSFGIAFDKDENLEFMIYRDIMYKDNMFYSEPLYKKHIRPIGTFLLMFLNTDFEDEIDSAAFIYKYCFESLYYAQHPKKKGDIKLAFIQLSLSPKEFITEIRQLAKDERDTFLYIKNIFLKNLNLPYDEDKIKSDEEDEEETINPEILPLAEKFAKDWDDYLAKREENRKKTLNHLKENFNDLYLEAKEKYNKRIEKNIQNKEKIIETYNHADINSLIEHLSLDFDMIRFLLGGINIYHQNIPYGFRCDNVHSVLALDFKEFKTTKCNIIRQCKNCGQYFIPKNLKETKYCYNLYEETGKTCKEIGKKISYEKSLKEDKTLDLYRRRYMSLASAVSHYGTDKAIERFEKYKTEGAIMKAKYQNKEISAEEFENWINSTKIKQ